MQRAEIFKNKSVLITGGTGSFGRAFARRLLLEDLCHKVIIFSRDEWKQWEMRESDPIFTHPKIRYFLGDVRDPSRLPRAFNEVNIIIHAAALKQVPAAEYNPSEFIKTNVNGAMHVIDAAISSGVEQVLALSTDKAVNPINLYGATKLCSDKLFVAGNSYVGAKGFPKFSVVRYGNVSGSRGSVLQLWASMLANGAKTLPVTDTRMTRFWITLDQAVDFVIHCLTMMKGREIFVPKIPSIHIMDLLEAFAPGMPHTITGIRDGEKLHEVMVGIEDARHTIEYDKHYVIIPEMVTRDAFALAKYMSENARFTPESFCYSSDLNPHWMSLAELKDLVDKFRHSH